MFGITYILYALAAYFCWWAITRIGLGAAWVYAEKGVWTVKHYAVFIIGLCPFVLEICSTILIIMAAAFGIEPKRRNFYDGK